MKSIIVKDFNLKHSLESGQIFNFEQKEGKYIVKHGRQVVLLEQKGNKLFYKGNKNFIINFLGLNEDFEIIKNHLLRDSITKKAFYLYPGLRLLKQDLWECLISFVCSSASNIPKIKKNITLLSKNFGNKRNGHYIFPKVGKIDDLKLIRECKTGYRAKYIYEINNIITKSWLNKVKKTDYVDAKNMLIQLPGVGEKIADCVCLFALQHYQSFPVDVWIKRVVEEKYLKKKLSIKKIQQFAQQKFYPFAGYSQQYLYYWRKNLKT